MFGSSQYRRRRLELTCPFCGNEQSEPSLAISSICRACGEHFKMENGVVLPPGGVRVSALSPVEEVNPHEAQLPTRRIVVAGLRG
ncbi:MAG: hypothetical protein KDL87_00125, partial [Verrucomicrobiae bacterium]|nr:hypothetical protein [Verrucomicrobiae bacterium]